MSIKQPNRVTRTKTANDGEIMIAQTRARDEYIHVSIQESKVYTVFLDGDITEPHNYRDLLSVMFNSTENDVIDFVINSGGGNLSTALAIIEAIKHTQARVSATVIGDCHSAASIILMACPEVIVCDSASCLIHTASYGISGNNGMVKAFTEFNVKQIDKLLDDTYIGFLTVGELENIKNGIEMWFSADEIRERLGHRNDYLVAKFEREEAEADQQDLTIGD